MNISLLQVLLLIFAFVNGCIFCHCRGSRDEGGIITSYLKHTFDDMQRLFRAW